VASRGTRRSTGQEEGRGAGRRTREEGGGEEGRTGGGEIRHSRTAHPHPRECSRAERGESAREAHVRARARLHARERACVCECERACAGGRVGCARTGEIGRCHDPGRREGGRVLEVRRVGAGRRGVSAHVGGGRGSHRERGAGDHLDAGARRRSGAAPGCRVRLCACRVAGGAAGWAGSRRPCERSGCGWRKKPSATGPGCPRAATRGRSGGGLHKCGSGA
jgi:hypothetical protein